MKRKLGFYLVFVAAVAIGAWAQDQSSTSSSQQEPSQTQTTPPETQPAPRQNQQRPNSSQPAPMPTLPTSSSSYPSSTLPRSSTTQTTPEAEEPAAQQEGPKAEYVQVTPEKGNTLQKLNFLGEGLPQSNLSLGLNVQGAYDSNIAAFSKQRQSQASWLVGPHLGISQYRGKLGMDFSYDGGLGLYDQLSNSNTYSQTFTGNVLYQITSRLQFHAYDNFTYTANPFGSYYIVKGTPTPENPNPNIYVPFAISNQNGVGANLSYLINQYDTVTFTGSEYYRRFSHYAYSGVYATGLYNNISYSGGANYSHRFSAKLSLGGGYNWTSLDFSHGQQKSGISAFQGFVNYQLNKSFSISGYAGPEYITAKTIIRYFNRYLALVQKDWVPGFGMNIVWQGLRNSVNLGLSRQVSDGGGLLATTTVYSANAGWRRKLSARWDGTLSASYGNNASFAATNLNRQLFPDRKYTLLSGVLDLDRQVTQRVTAHMVYAYLRETQRAIYLPPASGTYGDSRVSIQLQYVMNKPLGR